MTMGGFISLMTKIRHIMKMETTRDTGCNLSVQELIRISMQPRSGSMNNVSVTREEILQILFLARERLPEKNPLLHALPFYWYKDGPYSKTIDDNLKILVDEKKIHKDKIDRCEVYRPVPEHAQKPIIQHDDFMDAAVHEVRRVVDEFPKCVRYCTTCI